MRQRDLFRLSLGNYILTDGIYRFLLQKKSRDWGDKTPYYSLREYGSLSGGSVNFYEKVDDVFDNTSRYKQKSLSFTVFITGMSFSGEECWNQIHELKFVPKSSYKEWLKNVEVIMSSQIEKQMCGVGENIT